jgi:hypothetical protein
MSATGHLQTCLAQAGMSGSPLKADIIGREHDGRYGPRPEVTRRLNTFLQHAIEREAGANLKSCTNLWGSNRALVYSRALMNREE